MKVLKECPILIGIVVVAIALTVISLVFKDTAYAEYADTVADGKVPVLSLALKGAMDEVYPWTQPSQQEDFLEEDTDATVDQAEDFADAQITEDGVDSSLAQVDTTDSSFAQEVAPDISGNDVSGNDISGNSEPEVYEFTEVDDDYYSDALFIGDSRTVGLSEYCEELDTRATFYSKVSLTIFDVMKKEFIKTDDGKIGVEQALSENQFGKIYIMLGLNEIGTGDTEYFTDAYREVLDKIRELQPDAIIYIQGIMHVTARKSDKDKYFNNARINERNEGLKALADQKDVFFIDMNEAVDDENGNLDSSLSFDDVHLKASSYERWHEFLLHNAIVK